MRNPWRKIGMLAGLGLAAVTAAAQGVPGLPALPTPPPLAQVGGRELAGGVARGAVSARPLRLTLGQAIARGLQANLAALLGASNVREAAATHLAALSALLPQVQASAYDLRQKISLATIGLNFPGVPLIVGPFNVADARAYLHENLVNLSAIQDFRAANAGQKSVRLSYAQIRNLVVEAVSHQYLLTLADASQVVAIRAQVKTARTARQQARDRLRAGTISRLDLVRAEVELASERQRLITARNALAQQKLALARAIGLPQAQTFRLVSALPNTPAPKFTQAQVVRAAWAQRPDLQAALALVRSDQLQVAAAADQRWPRLSLDANYGTIGHTFTRNRPTYAVEGELQMPIFTGGRIRAQVAVARASLRAAEDRLADLRAQAAQQARDAWLNVRALRRQVKVARQSRGLARQELTLARDRFRAGLGDNLEEIQAQQQLALANHNYIQSLYVFNLAKISLAAALGVAAVQWRQYLEGTH